MALLAGKPDATRLIVYAGRVSLNPSCVAKMAAWMQSRFSATFLKDATMSCSGP